MTWNNTDAWVNGDAWIHSSGVVVGPTTTSANPNNTTNTSLSVSLGSPVAGELVTVEITGLATGTVVNPNMTTPSGWTKVGEVLDTNGTPASWAGVYYRIFQSGDPTSVTFSWANTGQMIAHSTRWTGFDSAAPIPYSVFQFKSTSDTSYSIAGTTGSAIGPLAYGFANRTGSTWSNLLDTERATSGLSSSSTMATRVTTELSGSSAFSKTATGSNTSVGVSWAFTVAATTGPPPEPTLVEEWIANTPSFIAHRGGSANFVEMTFDAYTKAVVWGAKAVEISVWRSSDGVWVASHDRTTTRMTGQNYDIPSTTWATLQTLRTTTGSHPLERLENIVAGFSTIVYVVENKQDTNVTDFMNTLDALGGPSIFIVKGYYPANTAVEARARNYHTWGYYYETEVSQLPSTHERWTLLGMDYTASQSAHDAVAAYNKPQIMHIIPNASGWTTAQSKGADGAMTADVLGVIPSDPIPEGEATLSGEGTLSILPQGNYTGSIGLSGSGQLELAGGEVHTEGSVDFSGEGSLSLLPLVSTLGAVNFAGEGSLSVAAQGDYSGSVDFSGSGTLETSLEEIEAEGSVSLSGEGSLSLSSLPTTAGTVTLAGSGTLTAGGAASGGGAVSLSGIGTLAVTGIGTGDGIVTLSGTGTLVTTVEISLDGAVSLAGEGVLSLTGYRPVDDLPLLPDDARLTTIASSPARLTSLEVAPARMTAFEITPASLTAEEYSRASLSTLQADRATLASVDVTPARLTPSEVSQATLTTKENPWFTES